MEYSVIVDNQIEFIKLFMCTDCYKNSEDIQINIIHDSVLIQQRGYGENPLDTIDKILDDMGGKYV